MYPYHIQRIQQLESADMCSRLELWRWINSNPHTVWFVTFFHRRGPHKLNMGEELLQRILSGARSINNAAVLHNVASYLVTQVRKRIQADGRHFEQLVWVFNGESVTVHLTTHLNKCTMLLFLSYCIYCTLKTRNSWTVTNWAHVCMAFWLRFSSGIKSRNNDLNSMDTLYIYRVCQCVCVCVSVCVCAYVCVYIYIYTHTHTHIHKVPKIVYTF